MFALVIRGKSASAAVSLLTVSLGALLAGRVALGQEAGMNLTSDDAYVRGQASRWVIGTAAMENVIALREGRLLAVGFKNKVSGREMMPAGLVVDELAELVVGVRGGGLWKLDSARSRKLKQGELKLELTCSRGPLAVTKHYVVFPRTSVIREWMTVKNIGASPVRLVEPRFLNVDAKLGSEPGTLDFHWMTGAENQPGCWVLKTEHLTPGKPRRFDSYDPFPAPAGRSSGGDGIDARITLNDKPIWPAQGWQHSKGPDDRKPFDLKVVVAPGDRLRFVVNKHGEIGFDTTHFDPTIRYEGGETHVASREFSGQQGKSGWRYGYLEKGMWHDLTYYEDGRTWKFKEDNATHTPFVAPATQHPHTEQDAVREWTALRAGHVRITGLVCNVGNEGLGQPGGHRMASSSYAPWYALFDRQSKDGLVIGWDYMGRWASSFTMGSDGAIRASLRVAGHKQSLSPGQSVTTPRAFVALYRDDLDNAGNELLDWQYRYLWDYTRQGWFPAVPMLGYWYKGTGWGKPGVSWVGGRSDVASQFTKVFRIVDLMREVGGDVYHRDWGWWDRAGDWNGPDFGTTNRYLRKYGMHQLVYAFLYTVDRQSKVAREHPDWLLGDTLDMSRPEVVAHIKAQLKDFHDRWGDFAWRNDSTPTSPRNGDDTVLLGQDQGLREIIRGFLDAYPKSSFQSVNGGGNEAGYDYVRLSSMLQFSDAAIGILRNYYASLLFPPDKLEDNGDAWNPDHYDQATWRGLLCCAIMTTGDTWDKAKLEGLRQLFDIYHYLAAQGVVGRWVKVYRPRIEGDDPTMYFERLSGDRLRGLIIPKRPATRGVKIYPKGLIEDARYSITFQESEREATSRGRELMEHGITIDRMLPGELIYLNLPLHPGSTRDRQPPTAPHNVSKRWAENMGYPGVEMQWSPGTDDNWISYYEIVRDGRPIDRLAKGTYYFDHSAGADLAARYQIRTVDGAGNASSPAEAVGETARRSSVCDDQDPVIHYRGAWRRQTGLQPAHTETISVSGVRGAELALTFKGKRILWFSKLGDNCGRAEVKIDDGPARLVDTYCSDDVWGVCVFRQELATPGKHTLRITVRGDHNPRSAGNLVHIDGLRAEDVSP
ncbi:MAG: hypothetical protein ACP5XB_05205 [Isosphaeraceae bacterium]